MKSVSLPSIAFAVAAATAPALAQSKGVVFTLSNSAASNEVLAYDRDAQGHLTFRAAYPTGGTGSDSGLGSQNAIWLSKNGKQLFAVNAGDDSVSAFKVTPDSLQLTDVESAQGVKPVALAQRGPYLYVVNSGAEGNVAGFRVTAQGALVPIPGALRALSTTSSAPAQIEVTPDGKHVVVTEKATGSIALYPVVAGGALGAPTLATSSGMTPFGFAFGKKGALIVSEAFGGAVDGSAVSSYRLDESGGLDPISASVPTTETAACWIALTGDGRFAYATNTGSGTVTGYRVNPTTAVLEILDDDGLTGVLGAGTNPLDAGITKDDRLLFVLSPATNEIAEFTVRNDGSLEKLPSAFGIPSHAVGLAVR
ncbi:MAG: lactonase family protein [Planctomycetes bacterium]|nr:lactonase family protein [Planctomycetota bacterium]